MEIHKDVVIVIITSCNSYDSGALRCEQIIQLDPKSEEAEMWRLLHG